MADLISSSMFTVIASVPRPTSMPFLRIAIRSATPTALFMFDCGLWTTTVSVSFKISISCSFMWTQCAQIVFGPSMPNFWNL
ncbi:MAG: hypothetical protein ACD_47C00363G0001 [uncultured bacterium]|nr:MAG: hypothetical protein ACD_47C00363G0001 [uncultured bacterium]